MKLFFKIKNICHVLKNPSFLPYSSSFFFFLIAHKYLELGEGHLVNLGWKNFDFSIFEIGFLDFGGEFHCFNWRNHFPQIFGGIHSTFSFLRY